MDVEGASEPMPSYQAPDRRVSDRVAAMIVLQDAGWTRARIARAMSLSPSAVTHAIQRALAKY